MRGISARAILLPVLLAGGLGACANNAVQPGIVNSSSGYSTASASTYGSAQPIGSGRVVAINDVSLQGGGGSSSSSGGMSNGTMMGGLLGGLGGIAIGASGGRGVGGGLIGGVLGAVAGGIAGTIIDRHTSIGGGGRGIEVTVQKDDGQQVTVAQRDDGDVQLGDRVQILQDRNGVAKAVRDNNRQQDYQNQNGGYQNAGPAPQDYRQAPPPQDYRQASNYGGSYGGNGNYGGGNYGGGGSYGGGYSQQPQDYRQGQNSQGYGPQPADYGQPQRYAPPQSSSHSGNSSYSGGGYQSSGYNGYQTGPQPQNDPRYGTLQ
jgi:outer membrane lipoprotein SlyB